MIQWPRRRAAGLILSAARPLWLGVHHAIRLLQLTTNSDLLLRLQLSQTPARPHYRLEAGQEQERERELTEQMELQVAPVTPTEAPCWGKLLQLQPHELEPTLLPPSPLRLLLLLPLRLSLLFLPSLPPPPLVLLVAFALWPSKGRPTP